MTGVGQYVKIALLDVALATLGHMGFIAEVEACDRDRPRYGTDLFGAFGRDFVTRDHRRLMIIALTQRQWDNLNRVTGLGERFEQIGRQIGIDLNQEGGRFHARESISAVLAPWIEARDYQDIAIAFKKGGVCFGPYQTVRELLDSDPEASLNNPLFKQNLQPGIGEYRMPGSPLYFSESDRLEARPAPRLGEHTDEVLSTMLGMNGSEIGRLHDAGIVAGVATI
jgi:2-methylfumaryl-CoA isomerase